MDLHRLKPSPRPRRLSAPALPVLVVAWILAFGARRIGLVYGRMQTVQKWLNRIVGGLFTVLGIYYCVIMYF